MQIIRIAFRRTQPLVLLLALLLTVIPMPNALSVLHSGTAQAAANVNIGDYLLFATYINEPILWRVIDKDADGDPLLFADRILTIKSFDAKGPYHTNSFRAQYGSNFYRDSNIRQWLNSSSNAITWLQNSPSSSQMYNGHNAYDMEPGFLSDRNFTAIERNAIKSLTHKVILPNQESSLRTGGTAALTMDYNIQTAVQNYDTTANHLFLQDSVFFLSVKQLKALVYDRGYPIHTTPTVQAVNQSSYKSVALATDKVWEFWLNTPLATSSQEVRADQKDGTIGNETASDNTIGVRPALQLKLSSAVVTGGSGTKEFPYLVDRGADRIAPTTPTDLSATNISATGLDLSWAPSTDNVGVAGYEIYQGSALLGTASGSMTTYSVTGLAEGTTYTFIVKAKDYKNNRSPSSTALAVTASKVKIGDYLQLGTYYDVPIIWRVIHKDSNGDPVLLSDRILTIKSFDAAGNYHQDANRQSIGSNYWPDSNLRQWLNSNEATVPWIQNVPVEANLFEGWNPYGSEKGFLANGNFTGSERALIKPLAHKTLLAPIDISKKDGGTEAHIYQEAVQSAVQNYDQAYFKNITDKVFLLSVKQIKEWIYDNRTVLGNEYQRAKPTAQAISNSTHNFTSAWLGPFNSDSTWYQWTSTTRMTPNSAVRVVGTGGTMIYSTGGTNYGNVGVRPALQVHAKHLDFKGGSGTTGAPFVVDYKNFTDTELPTPPTGLLASEISTDQIQLTWKPSNDNVAVTAYEVYRGTVLVAILTGSNGSLPETKYNVTGLTPNTSYMFSVRAKDAAGNSSPVGETLSVTTLVPPVSDSSAPSTPTGFVVSSKTATGFTLSWKASTDTGGAGLDGYEVYLGESITPLVTVTAAKHLFTGLQPNSAYSVRVLAYDKAGNKSELSSAYSVTTSADTLAPTVPTGLSHDVIGPTRFRLSWAASTDNVAVTGYEVFRNGTSVGKTANTNLEVTGLSENVVYNMTVKAYDAANKVSAASAVYQASTYLDQEAPSVPTGLVASNVTSSGFTVSWEPASDNRTVAGYEVYLKTGSGSVSKIGTTEDALFDVTELSPGTTYQLTVKAFDAAGPEANVSAASEPVVVTTQTDSGAPTVPDNLQAHTILGGSFVLTWEASTDDVGVDSYEIYKDGVLLKSNHKTLSFIVGELSMNTAYSMTVRAVDTSGMKSDASEPLVVTTTDSAQLGPALQIVKLSPVANETAALRYTLGSDAYMVIRILNPSNRNVFTVINNILTNDGTRSLVIPTKSIKNGKYYVQLIARDPSTGNRSIVYKNITIDHVAPVISTLAATSLGVQGASSSISFTVSESAYVIVNVLNGKQLVRTLVKRKLLNSGSNFVVWDGRDRRNRLVADGKYTVQVEASDLVGIDGKARTASVVVERAAPVISGLVASPIEYKATGTAVASIRFVLSESAKVTVRIYSSSNQEVRTVLAEIVRPAGVSTVGWNGKDTSGALVEAGTYTYKISATDAAGKTSAEASGTIVLTR